MTHAGAGSSRFVWEDPLQLELQLTDEERLIRDSARSFCQARLAPRVREAFRHEQFDRDIMREMNERDKARSPKLNSVSSYDAVEPTNAAESAAS